MANDEAEHNAARMLGCEISDDPLNPLLPIMQACRNHHPDEDLSILERAYRRAVIQHSSQRRKSGEPYIIHPLAVAQILADLGMGPLVVAPVCCTTPSRTPTTRWTSAARNSATR